jgi:hypothetical protein
MVASAQGVSTVSGILVATATFTGNADGFAVVSAVGKNVGWTPEPVASDTWVEQQTGSSSWTPQTVQSSNWQHAA